MALTALGSGWHERIRRVLGADFVEAELVQRLATYLDLVVDWNAKLDLTAARNEDELCDLFLADAVEIAKLSRDDEPGQWVDVGTGAGAPGLPLALLLANSQFTLVEPQQKRVSFLRTVIGTLGVDHVRVQRVRSEALAEASFDIALARATLPPEEWAREGARISRRAYWLLLATAELPSGQLRVEIDDSYVWPLTGATRRAVRVGVRRP